MNLKNLSNEGMITLTGYWRENKSAQDVLRSHDLGKAMNDQIDHVHILLEELHARRAQTMSLLEFMNAKINGLDGTHDRKVRSLHGHLYALIQGADDDDLRAFCEALLERLFPDGLSLVNRTYLDEAGWARTVDRHMTPDVLARMATISVGTHTLADLYRQWIDAGIALGDCVHERSCLQDSISSNGSAAAELNVTQVRSMWIRTVRALLVNIELMDLSPADRDVLLAPLRHSVAGAGRSRPGYPDTDVPASDPINDPMDDPDNDPINDPIDDSIDDPIDGALDDIDQDSAPGDILNDNASPRVAASQPARAPSHDAIPDSDDDMMSDDDPILARALAKVDDELLRTGS